MSGRARAITQMFGALLLVATYSVSHGAASASDFILRGKAIADAYCSACHAVGHDDETPSPVNANTAFRMLHERYPIQMLVEAARTGAISGHDEMPGFEFSPEDMHALLAYIDSFSPDKPGYATKGR